MTVVNVVVGGNRWRAVRRGVSPEWGEWEDGVEGMGNVREWKGRGNGKGKSVERARAWKGQGTRIADGAQ